MNIAGNITDAALVRRWQQGEAAAFETLVRRWEGPVARFVARLVGRPEQVADLCQEVFLRVFLAGPRYREKAAFSTWIYRIALNVARDAGRRQRHEPARLHDHEPESPAVSAEALYEQRELATAVDDALQTLPEPLREVIVLRHYEAVSFEDMARLLGTPASTLKSRFTAALSRLRQQLQPWDKSEQEIPR